jgi:hypothetical protein
MGLSKTEITPQVQQKNLLPATKQKKRAVRTILAIDSKCMV